MNSQRFVKLISQAQAGDKASLEQLLLQAFTPVSYQCRKLLQNEQAAKTITKKFSGIFPPSWIPFRVLNPLNRGWAV